MVKGFGCRRRTKASHAGTRGPHARRYGDFGFRLMAERVGGRSAGVEADGIDRIDRCRCPSIWALQRPGASVDAADGGSGTSGTFARSEVSARRWGCEPCRIMAQCSGSVVKQVVVLWAAASGQRFQSRPCGRCSRGMACACRAGRRLRDHPVVAPRRAAGGPARDGRCGSRRRAGRNGGCGGSRLAARAVRKRRMNSLAVRVITCWRSAPLRR